MAIKKKSEAAIGDDKTRLQVASRNEGDRGSTPKAGAMSVPSAQLTALEKGVRLFRDGKFAEAKEWFDRAAQGPDSAIAHTARTRGEICARRTRDHALNLYSADDHYHYGVERLNARDLGAALKHLETSLSLKPGIDYVLYAFAAAHALSGDLSAAYENLKRAIEIDPRNRTTARQDPDFAAIAHSPLFSPLLFPERHPSV
jgi:tetratricopeptide (TPR) repeat protein